MAVSHSSAAAAPSLPIFAPSSSFRACWGIILRAEIVLFLMILRCEMSHVPQGMLLIPRLVSSKKWSISSPKTIPQQALTFLPCRKSELTESLQKLQAIRWNTGAAYCVWKVFRPGYENDAGRISVNCLILKNQPAWAISKPNPTTATSKPSSKA